MSRVDNLAAELTNFFVKTARFSQCAKECPVVLRVFYSGSGKHAVQPVFDRASVEILNYLKKTNGAVAAIASCR